MVTNHVYTVAGAKGGVGKTTSSINLGTLLAEAGYSTVVVEMDLAMANLVDFLDVGIDTDADATFHDVLAGDASVTDAMYETDMNLSLVPSGTTLDGYADTDLDRLSGIVETLRWHHDIVLLDTPAGLSEETIQPLKLADDVLLVSTPRVASIRNVSNTQELAERVEAPVRGLILTKSGTGASPGAAEIAEFLDVELLGHVPEDDAVPHSQDSGTPVVRNAPTSGAAIAYERISRQLVDTEKASTGTTADAAAVEGSADSDDPEPTTRPAKQPPQRHSPGTTDGGRTVHPSDAIRDDGDPIGPAPAEQDGTGDPPADDVAELTDIGTSAASEADAEGGAETTSIIDGSELVASESAPVDGAEQHGDEAGRDTGASRDADGPEQKAGDSPSDTPSESNAAASDGAEADGLGARMRSLFGL
ncbi:septum site-determining protein MinD [Haloarcula vallismortis]|uniref:Septum site-determining protein MinD n=2 Tax=Haloarcula vallismortis TaxID=28442 RepID=M0JCY6_HALVA|nr:P-loop NTPase [Haloarcula vallismortis]EMA06851.1 septum site-determining protein MinD [Haloarcula vallismortis ATCC 29715]SDW67222.1 septum site-determining protein MinD [Haloarcula vallismortis]